MRSMGMPATGSEVILTDNNRWRFIVYGNLVDNTNTDLAFQNSNSRSGS